MSEKRSTKSLFLIGLMIISFLTPVLSSASADEQLDSQDDEYDAQGIIIGDLADFDPADGRQYLLIEEDTAVVSAYGFMKQAWIDSGRPGVDAVSYTHLTLPTKRIV